MIEVQHVKAHQDDHREFKKLNVEAKLNVLADEFAKRSCSNSTIPRQQLIPHLPKQQISLKTPFERITRDVDNEIVRLKTGHEAEKYLQRRWKLDNFTMRKIQWSDICNVIKKVPNYRKTQYAKILHKTWPTMKRNMEWKLSNSNKCPLCFSEIEDRIHIYRCRGHLAIAHRNQQLILLRKKLAKANTNPLITNHIIRAL